MLNFFRKNKLVLSLCVIFIVAIGLSINMAYIQKQKFIDTHKAGLQMLANEKAAQVNMFFEFQKEKFGILSSRDVFREVVLYPNDVGKMEAAKKTINELRGGLPRIAVFTKEGIMFIAESGPVPMDYSMLPYFSSKDKNVVFVRYYDEFQKKDYYSVLGPIYDEVEKDKVIGAIAFDVGLDKVGGLMKETIESQTNEVYLIDNTGLLLSASEYIGQGNKKGILIQEVKSEAAKECLADIKQAGGSEFVETHTEDVPQYLDYMGNEVFGAHAYAPAIGGCVIAEESADEILGASMLDYILNIFSKK